MTTSVAAAEAMTGTATCFTRNPPVPLNSGRTASRSALQLHWCRYIGWTTDTLARLGGQRRSVRVIARHHPYRLCAYTADNRVGYALYDESGRPLLKIVTDGNETRTLPHDMLISVDLLRNVQLEVAVLTNALADWPCETFAKETCGTSFIIRTPWDTQVRVRLANDGACIDVQEQAAGAPLYRPTHVAPLTRQHRLYSTWTRSGDTSIDIVRVFAGGKIYNGE